MDCILNNKPKIDYPCTWDYKVILAAKTDAKSLFEELLGENKYKCERGNSSKAGKYESYLLSIRVENEEHRLRLFELLKKHSKYLI